MINDTQRASLKVSLIPIVILIGLIIGAGYFLLQGEINLPKFNKGPTIQRIEGFPTVIYTDNEMEKERKVITSEQELNEFLNQIDGTGLLTVREKINFEKSVVLAVVSGTNNDIGHKIKIRKVYEDKEENEIRVEFEETNPEDDCKMELDKNITVDMVILSGTGWDIEFDKITKVIECEEEDKNDEEITDEAEGEVEEEEN